VSTLDFDRIQGNHRTQAATVMNQHAKERHPSQLRPSTPMLSVRRLL
jgi:hypothetical protein